MYAFAFHKPTSLAEAANLLSTADDPKLLAGGQTLIPTMKQRLASPANLIDLSGVAELRGIERVGDALVIGALMRHSEVATSAVVREAFPALAELAGGIGDPHVRQMGTIGGSVANNDPAADYPAALLALGATVTTNRREIPAEAFFTGMFETALEADEIVTRVSLPIPRRAAYVKFRNPASRYALVGVFVADLGGAVRVAVTGAGPAVFRSSELEQALGRDFSEAALKNVSVPADGLNSDIHASAAYRAHLIGVMARRAVAKAAA